jgi:uncharacterized membrane protein YvbJ
MDCPVCGNDNDDNVNRCSRCGTDFSFLKTENRTGDNPVNDVKKGAKEKDKGD